jgi:hypothetical protein
MPRYCTLWCLSEGIAEADEDDYLKNQDTYTEVLIDSISIRGAEPTVNNTTMGLHNPSAPPVELNSQPTTMNLFNQLQPITMVEDADVDATESLILSPSSDLIGKHLQAGSIWANSEESFDSVLPNYLSFGFKHTSALDSSATHLFLGGYACDNLPASDGTAATKRPKTINAWLGNQADIGRIMDDKDSTVTESITINGTNYVDYFTRKGHFTVNAGAPSWQKRENSFVSTKITDISRASEGRIKVADIDTLLASEEEEYVIYRQTGSYNTWGYKHTCRRTELKIKTLKKGDREIFFENDNGKLHLADNNSSPLCVEQFKDELYISPYRYWLIMEMWNLGSGGDALPAKSYSHVLSQGGSNGPAAGGRTFGMTYKEHLYSDSPKPSNLWEFTGDAKFLVYENNIDYGYGTYEEKETGYLNTPTPIILENTHTKVDISSLVGLESDRLIEVGSLVSLYIRTTANGTAKLHTGKVSTTANRPFLNVIYKDALPELLDFKVQPNEKDPFYPTFTWSTGSEDLWYGFLIQDDKSIEHQYHSAVAHIPLNETGTATYLYRYDGSYAGSIATRVTATNVGKTTSIEGLAGNCLEFDGSTIRYSLFADGSYTEPSAEMSIVAHFAASAADDTHYIVSKYNQFGVYVDSSGYINAKVFYYTTNSVNLKSISPVPTDGKTPVNVIVTLDTGLPNGNVKLFINGKLEDQSGVKTTDGSTSNWKIDTDLPNTAEPLVIGIYYDGDEHHFEGKIEEIVIYNKAIYPVVPQTGELSLFKPITELTTASIASGKSIVSKLFIKDYHNIRGTTVNQVTSSSMVAYRKSGVGFKTN